MLNGTDALTELRSIKKLREEPQTKEMKGFGVDEMVHLFEGGLMTSFRKSMKKKELGDELASFFMFLKKEDNVFLAEILDEAINRFAVRSGQDDRQIRREVVRALEHSRHAGMSVVRTAVNFLHGDRYAFKKAA